MRVTRVRIKNFRSIKDLDLPLAGTTVLIGPNNAGKTAILEAIRIALTRRWGQRGTGFTEYDFHLDSDESDPKQAPPIQIEIELSEKESGEWGEELHDELNDIVQLDAHSGRATIIMRVTCSWDTVSEAYIPKWEFLGTTRVPLTGRGARLVNMSRFFEFIPAFYLDALRDAGDEFTARSQFWGKLLRSVNVPSKLSTRAETIFKRLNRRFLEADPKMGRITANLRGVKDIAIEDEPGDVAIRVVPFKTWDLLSRSQVILKNATNHPWLPLSQHGRGVQSLSVIFIFHAFVAELLTELYRSDSEAFLALEEPETHLHPQAARTLWRHVKALPGQKLVTTHSPYFVQHVPFRDLRLIRTGTDGTTFSSLPEAFECIVPAIPTLPPYIATRGDHLAFDAGSGRLSVKGQLQEAHYRDLLTLYAAHADRASVHADLRALKNASAKFVSDEVLKDLEEYARRIRGEIFFAKRWLLVEGQSDYVLAHAIGDALGYSLDANGVAVIDCVNNGNPQSFAVLARALDIPWCAVFDNDDAGRGYITSIQARSFDAAEVGRRCGVHASGELEDQLVAQGNEVLMRDVAAEIGVRDSATCTTADLLSGVKARKVECAVAIAKRLDENPALVDSMPEAFVNRIRAFGELA